MGMVLLELDHGGCGAVELEGRDGCWDFTEEDVGEGL